MNGALRRRVAQIVAAIGTLCTITRLGSGSAVGRAWDCGINPASRVRVRWFGSGAVVRSP